MPTNTQKTIAGALLLGASVFTGNALLVTAAQGVGGNWTAEGLMGLWSRVGQPPTPRAALLRAGEQAIVRAADTLERAYQHEDRDVRAFALVRECASVVAAAQYPAEAGNPIAVQQALAAGLNDLLYGHAARQFLQDRLLDAVTIAFREALAADEQAWFLFHGWLLEQLGAQTASIQQQLQHLPEVLALLHDQTRAAQALAAALGPLQRQLLELHAAVQRSDETTFDNQDVDVGGQLNQSGGSIYDGTQAPATSASPPASGARFANKGVRVKGDVNQAGGDIYIKSAHEQEGGTAIVINRSDAPAQPTQVAATSPHALELAFVPTANGAQVRWESHGSGVVESALRLPYPGDDLALVLRALDALQHGDTYPQTVLSDAERQRLALYDLADGDGTVFADAHRRVGRALFAALTADARGALALGSARNHASASGAALALRLRFPPAAISLAALPWELLWDDEPAPLLFSRQARHSCTRHLDIAQAIPPTQPRDASLRILALAPHARIDVATRDGERAARAKAWQPMIDQGLVAMREVSPATRAAVIDAVQDFNPHIIHYYGHGHYVSGRGGELLLDAVGGGNDWTPVERLVAMIGAARLVVLHACQGAMVAAAGTHGLRSGIAPALSAEGVPLVIGMQLTMRIDAATRASAKIYSALSQGLSVQEAVSRARQALYAEEDDGCSWYVPVLYIRSRETGPVFLD